MTDNEKVKQIVEAAERFKNLPKEQRVGLLMPILLNNDDDIMKRWAMIMLKYDMPIENVLSAVLSLCEDTVLTSGD